MFEYVDQRYLACQVNTLTILFLVRGAALLGRSGKDHEGIVFGYVEQRYLAYH